MKDRFINCKVQILMHCFLFLSFYSYAQEKAVRLAIESYYSDEEDLKNAKNYNPRNFEEVYPFDPNGFVSRGVKKFESEFYDESLLDFSESIALAPECGVCYYYRGNNYMAMDSLSKGKSDLEKAISLEPLLIEAYNDLSAIYISEDNLDSAKYILQEGIDYFPAFPYTYFNLGLVETLRNKPAKALKQFRKCLEFEPCHSKSYSYIISIYLYKSNLQKAESTLDEVLNCMPDKSEFYLWKSILKFFKGKKKDAIVEINKAIEKKESYSYYYFRGLIYGHLNEYSKSINDFSKAFEINPVGSKEYKGGFSYRLFQNQYQDVLVYYSKIKGKYNESLRAKVEKGMCKILINDNYEAEKLFEVGIKKKSRDGFIYLLSGINKEKIWKKEQALNFYNKSISMDSNIKEAYKRRGLIYRSRGALNEAIRDFSRMYTLDENSSEALKYKGIARILNGQEEGGLLDLREYERKFEKDKDVFYNIAQCETFLGNYEEGIKYYKKVLKEDPEDTEAMYKIAENNYALGKFDECNFYCDSLLKANECYVMALNLKGVIQMDSSNVEKAIEYFSKTVECSNGFVDGYINRSLMNIKLNKNGEALFDVNTALQLDPNSSLAYLVRAQIKYNLGDDTACNDLNKAIELGMEINDTIKKAICK